MKAVILCRVSSREQEETGYSLSSQEKLLTTYSQNKNFEIVKLYSFAESASGKKQREAFNELMNFVIKNNIKIIVCEKVDRLTRNFKDAVMIDNWLEQDSERSVHLVKDSLILNKNSRSQEKLNWGIRIIFAKNAIDNLSEEVKKGQKEKVLQGWLPTKPPPGYKTIGEKGHKTHIIDDSKSGLVKNMFDLYATKNYSLSKLTKKMYDDGLRNAFGNKIVKSRIHKLLSDPFYIGKIRWNGEINQGNQDKLINDDLFNKVQEILTNKSTPKYRKHNYLYSGIFKCGECKGTITWEIHKNIIYGHCNHYKNCTQKTWYIQDNVEELLKIEFNKLQIRNLRIHKWIEKAMKLKYESKISFHNSSITSLKSQQKIINNRLENMYIDKIDNKITSEFYDNKFKEFKEELNQIEANLQKHNSESINYQELGSKIFELSQRSDEIYKKSKNNENKRILINLIFESLYLINNKLVADHSVAFKLISELVLGTNSSKKKINDKIVASIFEPKKQLGFAIQTNNYYPIRPILLRG